MHQNLQIYVKFVQNDHLHMEDKWNQHHKGYMCDVRNEVTLEPTPLDTCRRGRCHRHYPGTNCDPGPPSPEAHSCHIAHHFAAAGFALCEGWHASHVMIVCSLFTGLCIVGHIVTSFSHIGMMYCIMKRLLRMQIMVMPSNGVIVTTMTTTQIGLTGIQSILLAKAQMRGDHT